MIPEDDCISRMGEQNTQDYKEINMCVAGTYL